MIERSEEKERSLKKLEDAKLFNRLLGQLKSANVKMKGVAKIVKKSFRNNKAIRKQASDFYVTGIPVKSLEGKVINKFPTTDRACVVSHPVFIWLKVTSPNSSLIILRSIGTK